MKRAENTESIQDMLLKITHLYYRSMFSELKADEVHPKQLGVIELLYRQEGIIKADVEADYS